jgi:hypothetical protein
LIVAVACLLFAGVLALVLGVRSKDIPPPEPEYPFAHLDERRAAIYDNLRDLQFEYRVGKLSEADYQTTKRDLQKELAGVLAAVDQLKAAMAAGLPFPAPPASKAVAGESAAAAGAVVPGANCNVCPSCGARFETPLRFCGECGKPMKGVQA